MLAESGAFKALTLDLAERDGPAAARARRRRQPGLRAALPDFMPVSNPMDLTAQGLVDPDLYRARPRRAASPTSVSSSVLLAIIQTDAATAKLKFPPIIAAIETLQPAKPVIFAGLDEGAPVPPDYVERLRALGVPYFPSPDRAFRALARLARWGARVSCPRRRDRPRPRRSPAWRRHPGISRQGRARVGRHSVSARRVRDDAGEAAAIAAKDRLSRGDQGAGRRAHKSDAGGVILGLRDEAALERGWAKLADNVGRNRARPQRSTAC